MSVSRVDVLGDSALLLQVRADAPLEANAQVHVIARALRLAGLRGVRDIVPGMYDLVVHVDPLRCDPGAIESVARSAADDFARAARAAGTPGPDAEPAAMEVPVHYGGEAGPDLEDVASACGLSPEEVCQRHAAPEYVVCFVGFQPGFPYLGLLDPVLRLPRRAVPRPRVPPGSVAIAGEYTGIYPWPTPGGWHLIGRTDLALFDLGSDPPARLSPGTRVRFVPRHA